MSKKIKIFLIVFFITILILLLSSIIFGYLFIQNKLNKVNYEELKVEELSINENILEDINSVEEVELTQEQFNEIKTIAIFGSDSRNIQDTYDDARSDVIIIVSVNPNNKKITMISIPRDTYVDIPGYGKTKINHAFAYGKEQLAIKTIQTFSSSQ